MMPMIFAITLLAAAPSVSQHVYSTPCASTIRAYHQRETKEGFSADAKEITRDSRNTQALLDLKQASAFIQKAPIDPRDRALQAVAQRHIKDATQAVLSVAGPKAAEMYEDLTPCVGPSRSTHLLDAHFALDIAIWALQHEIKHRPHISELKSAFNSINAASSILPDPPTGTRLRQPHK